MNRAYTSGEKVLVLGEAERLVPSGGDHHIIRLRKVVLHQPEGLAEAALEPIADDRPADASADGEAEPGSIAPGGPGVHRERAAGMPEPGVEDGLKLPFVGEAMAGSEAEAFGAGGGGGQRDSTSGGGDAIMRDSAITTEKRADPPGRSDRRSTCEGNATHDRSAEER